MAIQHLIKFHIRNGGFISLSLFLFLTISCSSLNLRYSPPFPGAETPEERMVLIALEDFVNIKQLAKQDTIFSIRFQDSVFHRMIWNNETKQWQRGALYPGVKCVQIIGESDVRFPANWESAFPHHYFLHQGKLFLWYGGSYKTTQTIKDIMYQWKIIDPSLIWMEFSENDRKKAAYYFFKSDGSLHYKRKITNKTVFEPPKGL